MDRIEITTTLLAGMLANPSLDIKNDSDVSKAAETARLLSNVVISKAREIEQRGREQRKKAS